MAFLFRSGGPPVGAVRALVAGVMAWVAPGVAPAADISKVADQARLLQLPERIATIAIGNPPIADVMMRAGGSAAARARAQRDRGRSSV
jgi:hypothetical protein